MRGDISAIRHCPFHGLVKGGAVQEALTIRRRGARRIVCHTRGILLPRKLGAPWVTELCIGGLALEGEFLLCSRGDISTIRHCPCHGLVKGGAVQEALTIRRRGARRTVCHRSEEHTSELQSLRHLVCRLLLEKK